MSFAGYSPSLRLSNFTSLSDNISNFLQFPKVHNVGEMITYDRHPQVFSHWIWSCGMRKGLKVENSHAEALLKIDNCYENLLEPVYVSGPFPVHSESKEIQDMLGDIKVDEYGSFTDQSFSLYSRSHTITY